MPRHLSLTNVSSLTLGEIIERWAAETSDSPQMLEHELRLAVVNLRGNWREGDRIDPCTRNEDLPNRDTLVDRGWLKDFCEKQRWLPPTFWFPPDPEDVRRPGRPTIRTAIVQEFEKRRDRGDTQATISKEARAIHASLTARGVDSLPEPKTIQGHIRDGYNAWKASQNL